MQIVDVRATPVNVPAEFDLGGEVRSASLGICIVEVKADDGRVGVGMTSITEEEVVASAVNNIAAPMLKGEDPLRTERIWDRLYWLMTPRGQSGYASHAIAAIDVALWDLKGQILEQPVWVLLGGARPRVPCYATVGFDFFDNDQLAEVARQWQAKGFDKFKMVVGHNGLKRRDEPRPLKEVLNNDVRRVEVLRNTVGEDCEIFVDANCNLDAYHAEYIARRIEPYGISFFEEPIMGNDVTALADLRRRVNIPLAGGQNEGQASKFKDLLLNRSLDVLQPNVVITGGYTQCLKIAGMAEAFGLSIDNGGAWPFHNMNLHAGVRNGGMVEYHLFAVECLKKLFKDVPEPENGWITLPDTPGIGFSLDTESLAELARRPTSGGQGKG